MGMVDQINGVYCLLNWGKHQNVEGLDRVREQTRKRVQNFRNRQLLLQSNCNVTENENEKCNVTETKNRQFLPQRACNVTETLAQKSNVTETLLLNNRKVENENEPSNDQSNVTVTLSNGTEEEIRIKNKNIEEEEEIGGVGDSSTAASIIFKSYESNIGMLTPIIVEKIKASMEDYPVEWIIKAIEKAVSNEKRSWGYVEGILRGWRNEGFNNGSRNNGHNGNNGHKPERIKQSSKYKYVN
jgi:DnaD/phage-associated family protein